MRQRTKKTIAAGLSALLFLGYFSPSMTALRDLPEAAEPGAATAAGPWIRARSVRSSGDERLSDEGRIYALFGLVPLKTVQTAPRLPIVRLGGQAAGVILYTKGVQVVGLTAVETTAGAFSPASAAGLKKGDAILAVDGQPVAGAAGLTKLLQGKAQVDLTILRETDELILSLRPAAERGTGVAKLGAWVRESTSGIGTL